jgi:hypothetical protein
MKHPCSTCGSVIHNDTAMTERHAVILGMALRYMRANIDDVNDSFPIHRDDADFNRPDTSIEYAGRIYDRVREADVNELLGMLGED